MSIRVEALCLAAGDFRRDGLEFAVEAGCYAVLMGRTGCGKTTFLETLCGLLPARAGRVLIEGRDVTRLRAAERGIGYVPQDAALFPTMTVREQVGFALRIRRQTQGDIHARTAAIAEQLGIAHLLDRRPAGLSGGERQRVALGRALSFRPGVLLLDEPLAALDDETRDELHVVLRDVHRESSVTILHVTHSEADAAALADAVWRFTERGIEPS